MRILVVGAGAVGGYFGARLAEGGRDVTFLVRPARAELLRRDGLRVKSPHGDIALSPEIAVAADLSAPYDVILLSVKAYALDAAMADFAPAVGPASMILPMLNGMRHIETLEARFGAAPVLGGVCRVAADIDAEGRIVQMAPFQQLVYGERAGGMSPRIEALDATLTGAGFEAIASGEIMQAMWEKWILLASLGAITCLMRGAIGEVVAARGGEAFARQVLGECISVATACGYPPTPAFRAMAASTLTAVGSTFTSSMYRDLRKGAPVEAEQILGDMIFRGAAHRLATPLLNAAFVHLQVYQAARPAG